MARATIKFSNAEGQDTFKPNKQKDKPSSKPKTSPRAAPASPRAAPAQVAQPTVGLSDPFPIPAPADFHAPQAHWQPREPRPPELERLAAELATVKPQAQEMPAHTCAPLAAPRPVDSSFAATTS